MNPILRCGAAGALVFALVGVAPLPVAAGDWHGDVSYAATGSAPNVAGFRVNDERMTRTDTPLDGGAVVDVGGYVTRGISPLLQVAADVQRIAWASEDIEFDLTLLRADLLGGVRLLPPGSDEHTVDVFADVLAGAERVSIPRFYLPQSVDTDAVTAPASVVTLGVLAGKGRIRALASLRLRMTWILWSSMVLPSCLQDSPCISWSYGPGGFTAQALLGVAFR